LINSLYFIKKEEVEKSGGNGDYFFGSK